MSTALSVPTSYTYSRTFARGNGKPDFVSSFIDFNALNARSDLVGFPSVMSVFVIKELDTLQMVRPDTQSTCACGFSVVTVEN